MTQLQSYSLQSLHPPTLFDLKVPLKSNDLEAIHQHMNSMALQNPDKHFEEAKSIIDGGSEFLHAKENEAKFKENENPQKNRPALARKRAKFSLKPDISHPSTNLEPVFQFDQLQNPEEFFAAYEKFENTVKELRRQRGEDLNDAKVPTTARQRRPEIPRRKISYQHHVYSSQSQSETLFSQETLQDTSEIPPVHGSQQETNEKEVAGSRSKAEDKVNKLFDVLMSSDIANLDENEATSYLKDQLKIKPVDINNLQLPSFHNNISKIHLISSVKNLTKDQSILPDTRAFSDSLKDITLGKQKKLPDKPFNLSSSPTPPRRPILSTLTFGNILPESTEIESNVPFSAHDIDSFPTTTTSEIISRHSTSASKHSISEPPITMEDLEQGHDMEEMDVVTDVRKNEDIQGKAEDMVQKAVSHTKLNSIVEDIAANAALHCVPNVEVNIEDATEKVVSSSPPEGNLDITTIEELESDCFQSVQANDSSVNVFDASLPVQNPDIILEQQNKEHTKKSMNYSTKTRASKVDVKKKRHSLAGAGSSWTTGVRRSKRIKRKPLEYWKGERVLYARVHNSLPTIIGVKYLSPSDHNGRLGFKVESFVAEEYKDLVELISLH